MAVFTWPQHNWVLVTEIVWPTETKIFTLWSLQKKVASLYLNYSESLKTISRITCFAVVCLNDNVLNTTDCVWTKSLLNFALLLKGKNVAFFRETGWLMDMYQFLWVIFPFFYMGRISCVSWGMGKFGECGIWTKDFKITFPWGCPCLQFSHLSPGKNSWLADA